MAIKVSKDLLATLVDGSLELPEGCHATPHKAHAATVRRDEYRGRSIEVRTTYEILVDGKPFGAHAGVSADGTVHTHALPQYAFRSALDMVRKVIDAFDVELPDDELQEGTS